MHSITIIGTGLAGYNLAKEIRKLDKELPLTIITADGGESYSTPVLDTDGAHNHGTSHPNEENGSAHTPE